MNAMLDRETPAAELGQAAPGEAGPGHKEELRLWLRMLTCTTMIETTIRSRLRQQFGVTLPRFDLMAQLEKAPAGMTLGELSRRMMVSNGNVTGLIERLVTAGEIERQPHPTDGRATTVRLTADGRRSFATMAAAHQQWVATLFADVPRADLPVLMAALGRVKRSVRAA